MIKVQTFAGGFNYSSQILGLLLKNLFFPSSKLYLVPDFLEARDSWPIKACGTVNSLLLSEQEPVSFH